MSSLINSLRHFSFLTAVLCLILVLLVITNCSANKNIVALAPVELVVGEGFESPIGHYESQPRFSWKIAEGSKSKFQTAYQIQVFSDSKNIQKADYWDSKKQTSTQSSWVTYQGKNLHSRQKLYWRVRVWDENNIESNWSEIASVELGLLTSSDWQASWIRHPEIAETYERQYRKSTVTNKLYRPQYLRTQFVTKSSIKSARLYITSKGIFESYINGQQVGSDVMTPGWTPYLKRIETLTYDVTNLINDGPNVLAATVAEGWYTGRILAPQKRDVKPSALLAQLEIQYADGSIQIIKSDDKWKASVLGPIRLAGNYDGETYDANFEIPAWNTINFDDSQWQPVLREALDENVALTPKRHTAPTTKLIIPATNIIEVANPKLGVVVFDMGQNMLGVPEINIPVVENQKVTLRFSEALEHNKFYVENLRSALATDYYIPAKTGNISYTPKFTFHGFRYVEISGFDKNHEPDLSWVKGLVLHSDFDVTASFTSSHAKLNKLAENVVWGLRGNFLDIPTDCPQRDERLGWTGDAQVFAAPSMYMADVYGFWSAWMQSVREEQDTNGRIPNFVPTKQNKHTKGASSGWGDVVVIVPWELYLLTGDKQILVENYSMIQGWLNYHASQSENFISHMNSFQDWLQPYPSAKDGKNARRGDTPQNLISTAYYAHVLNYAAKIADVLGHNGDSQLYTSKLAQVKKAFRTEFYDENAKVKSIETQTSYLLPLGFDLFTIEDKKMAQQHLVAVIQKAENHLGTGFLGTPLLAPVLQDMGRSDLMYDILFKETYPSWFYSINNGATTTWERWNSYSLTEGFNPESMNSLNHYAYGAVAKWFYEGILGISATEAGFKRIKIAPQFTNRLSNASGEYMTPHGKVAVAWNINNSKLTMNVVIPKNTLADIDLSGTKLTNVSFNDASLVSNNQLSNLQPGNYKFEGIVNLSLKNQKN